MNNIIIRTAKQDYVCACCGHAIRKGDEYLDRVVLNTGKVVRHERYHDECPYDRVIDLFKAIKDASYNLPCADKDGNKYKANFIAADGLHITSWDNLETGIISLDIFFKEYNY